MFSFNPIMVDNYAAFFNCTPMGRASYSMMVPTEAIHFSRFGPKLTVCYLAHRGSTGVFLLLQIYSGLSIVGQVSVSVSHRF